MQHENIEILNTYKVLKPLSKCSAVLLCKENATNRLVVIKKYKNEKTLFFKKEVEALCDLADTGLVPQLYFASEEKDEKIIAIQFKGGKTLREFINDLNHNQIMILQNEVKDQIKKLHHTYLYAHGDINLNNVLVKQNKDKFSIIFIDWEFSEKMRNESTDNYIKFRGTLGSTPSIESNSLFGRDLLAIDNIFKQFVPRTKSPSGSFLKKMKEWI